MRFVTLSMLLLLLAACGPFPDDLEGTLDKVHDRGTINVGLTTMRAKEVPLARAYIARLERAAHAHAVIDEGPAELQFARLEQGAVDVVIGDFAEDSPWNADVALIEPLATRTAGTRKIGLSPVAANGENRWIALLEREVRDYRASSR